MATLCKPRSLVPTWIWLDTPVLEGDKGRIKLMPRNMGFQFWREVLLSFIHLARLDSSEGLWGHSHTNILYRPCNVAAERGSILLVASAIDNSEHRTAGL
jgi:hypothetical protein